MNVTGGTVKNNSRTGNPNCVNSYQATLVLNNGRIEIGASSKEISAEQSTVSCVSKVPLSVLEEDSKIFGKNSDKPLTHYQMEINKAAFALCKEDASLLKRRNELFDKAKQKIDQEGFQYKKRHSRSKVFGQTKTL